MKRNLLPHSLVFLLAGVFLLSFTSLRKTIRAETEPDTAILPLFSKAIDYKAKNVSNTSGLVTLTSGLSNDYYLLDPLGRTGYLYVETKIARLQNANTQRVPLNLSIVIDRSGSMAGEKMDSAKKAAKGIIDKLLPEDYVSVVIYDEYIDVLQPSVQVVHKDSIKAKIEKIKPRGSTNLWGGSERGYEQVKAAYKPGYINRVLLISDGRANAGTIHPHRIREKVQEYKDVDGITISTFGLGLDYNETLMTDMAETGAGNYYYIDKAEKMEVMFEKELSGLLNGVAQNAELRITLPKGITLLNVYPFKYTLQKGELVIKYRDLFSEETKAVIIQFAVKGDWDKDAVFTAKLTYTDIGDKQQKTITNENVLRPTKSTELYSAHFNKSVAKEVILFTGNEKMERAMAEADRGKYDRAKQMMEENLAFLRNKDYEAASSADLKRMDTISAHYVFNLDRMKEMNKDSINRLQKSTRAESYRIRNKKNVN